MLPKNSWKNLNTLLAASHCRSSSRFNGSLTRGDYTIPLLARPTRAVRRAHPTTKPAVRDQEFVFPSTHSPPPLIFFSRPRCHGRSPPHPSLFPPFLTFTCSNNGDGAGPLPPPIPSSQVPSSPQALLLSIPLLHLSFLLFFFLLCRVGDLPIKECFSGAWFFFGLSGPAQGAPVRPQGSTAARFWVQFFSTSICFDLFSCMDKCSFWWPFVFMVFTLSC